MNPIYKLDSQLSFDGHASQTLLPDEFQEKNKDKFIFLDAKCKSGWTTGYEITNNNELVEYGDGTFFFYRKIK